MKKLDEESKSKLKSLYTVADALIRHIDEFCELLHAAKAADEARLIVSGIKQMRDQLEDTEYAMQRVWGFDEDPNKHSRWMRIKHCKCPRHDNAERWGAGFGFIYNEDCPVHGDAEAIVNKIAWDEYLRTGQPMELDLRYSDGTTTTRRGLLTYSHPWEYANEPDGYFTYAIRHSDDDDSVPVTVEVGVGVNRYGYFITDTEFSLYTHGNDGSLRIDDYSFLVQ